MNLFGHIDIVINLQHSPHSSVYEKPQCLPFIIIIFGSKWYHMFNLSFRIKPNPLSYVKKKNQQPPPPPHIHTRSTIYDILHMFIPLYIRTGLHFLDLISMYASCINIHAGGFHILQSSSCGLCNTTQENMIILSVL